MSTPEALAWIWIGVFVLAYAVWARYQAKAENKRKEDKDGQ